jgi:hypothetical protein
LYGIVATSAPVVIVFQRGPSKLWAIHRWDSNTDELTTGAVFRGTLYPRRCDVSPDGTLLSYFALQGWNGEWLGQPASQTYSAISKTPWLFALAAWRETGTYTRGHHFVPLHGHEHDSALTPAPQAGEVEPLHRRHRLTLVQTAPIQYAVERRRGWIEDTTSPPQSPDDMWDENRNAILTKERPFVRGESKERLVLADRGISWERAIEHRRPSYRLEQPKRTTTELPGVTWADWDPYGRLLVATEDGRLQIRNADEVGLPVVREHVLSSVPARVPAPDWARTW